MSELRVKPVLRGVSHQISFFLALVAGAVLIAASPGYAATVSSSVYAGSLAFLFGASALYHRPTWRPAARLVMQRIDHSAIFLLIAGTYTPIAVLTLGGSHGFQLLLLAWGGASLGIAQSILWPHAPKPVSAAVYLLFGWAVVPYLPVVVPAMATADLALIGAGGLLYTIGAFVYALRRPDPFPRVFGYHEIFHALVVAASVCHFIAITRLVLTPPVA